MPQILLKRLGYFLLFSISAIGTARFCHYQTRGFALAKIGSNFPLRSTKSTEHTFPIQSLENQTFTFLSRGLQSFVFASKEGDYVLKLFLNRPQWTARLAAYWISSPLMSGWALARCSQAAEKTAKAFESYRLAATKMPSQTELLYLHLCPDSTSALPMTLVDPLGITHKIDLFQHAFLIQRRAVPSYPALGAYLAQGDLSSTKAAISSLLDLFFWKWEHCIADHDPLIRSNYGFLGTRAIQIDVGPLSKQEERQDKTLFCREIYRITASLKAWLQEHAPELVSYLDQELSERLS